MRSEISSGNVHHEALQFDDPVDLWLEIYADLIVEEILHEQHAGAASAATCVEVGG